jgi:PIN domain nuclease of toxin-antitoxin system
MIVGIADTHAALWYLFSDPRLGNAASSFIDDAVSKGNHIGVSAISIAEIVYLVEKGRIVSTALADLSAATADPRAVLRRLPLDHDIAAKMAEIPREDVPDLPDRVIAATGLFYRVSVLSRDSRIKASAIQTIW